MKKRPMTRSEIMSRIRSVSDMERGARHQVKHIVADMMGVAHQSFRLISHPKGLRLYGNPDYTAIIHHWPVTPTKPQDDLSEYEERIMVFVHGSFWHGYGYPSRFKLPKTNTEFWRNKIERNRARHRQVVRRARRDGWTVLTVWDFQLRAK